jgi:hypothetical protein
LSNDNDRPTLVRTQVPKTVSDLDLELARRIPDDFVRLPGSPMDRVVDLVNRHWEQHTPQAKAELAQALLPVLLDLLNSSDDIANLHRGLCQNIVATWIKRQQDKRSRAS